jgi:hypothetical protein
MKSGRADLVLLARGLLREPYWPRLALRALGHTDAVAGFRPIPQMQSEPVIVAPPPHPQRWTSRLPLSVLCR